MQASRITIASAMGLAVIGAVIVAQIQAQERLDHLLKAADHLEQAGLPDQSAEIRSLARNEMRLHGQQLLQQKLAQLEALQTEIEGLRQAITQGPQIRVQLTVCEYQLSKLEAAGLGFVSLRQLLSNETPTCFVDDSGKLTEFIQILRKQELVHTIAAPSLLAADGATASVSIGVQGGGLNRTATADNTPARTDNRQPTHAGIRGECTPKILNDQRVSLAIRLQQPATKSNQAEPVESGKTAGTEPRFAITTQVDLATGQTLIIGGAVTHQPEAEAVGMLVLVSAEIIARPGETPARPATE